jgi:cyclohexa-1,5-dienecarbonyl-CoA hydratase
MSVFVSFSGDQARAALRLFHAKGNIITSEIIEALRSAIESVSQNPQVKLVTIEGTGDDFSFGASIPEHVPDQIGRVLPQMHRLIEDLLELHAPTAAVVRGRCLGGGFELALACDFIFAADDAVFGLPEIALGVFPPAAAALLPLRVGASRATRAILVGDLRPATAWKDAGILELVVPARLLGAAVDEWFERHLAPKSAAALRHAATAARTSLVAHVQSVLPRLERLYLEELMRTHDAAEGIDAFIHKRSPNWLDR